MIHHLDGQPGKHGWPAERGADEERGVDVPQVVKMRPFASTARAATVRGGEHIATCPGSSRPLGGLVTLSRSLDQRASGDEEAPSYLDLAVLVAGRQHQLDDLVVMLVHYAGRYEGTTWTEVAHAFGISRAHRRQAILEH